MGGDDEGGRRADAAGSLAVQNPQPFPSFGRVQSIVFGMWSTARPRLFVVFSEPPDLSDSFRQHKDPREQQRQQHNDNTMADPSASSSTLSAQSINDEVKKMMEGGVVALPGMPGGSSVTVDGCVVSIKRDDFLAFVGVPNDGMHLIALRSNQSSSPGGLTTGLILASFGSGGDDNDSDEKMEEGGHSSNGEALVFDMVRLYDTKTQELCPEGPDQLTRTNLLRQIRGQQVGQQQVLLYDCVVPLQYKNLWKTTTNYVSARLLRERKLAHGSKVVPSGEMEDMDGQEQQQQQRTITDGAGVSYPPIACVDKMYSAHRTKHHGTKRFLSSLSPRDRTMLLTSSNPSKEILHRTLEGYYRGSWKMLIGDIQLSFVMFLYIQCLASLEHWRDLVAMLSLACRKRSVNYSVVNEHSKLYEELLLLLQRQLSFVEEGFLEVRYKDGTRWPVCLETETSW